MTLKEIYERSLNPLVERRPTREELRRAFVLAYEESQHLKNQAEHFRQAYFHEKAQAEKIMRRGADEATRQLLATASNVMQHANPVFSDYSFMMISVLRKMRVDLPLASQASVEQVSKTNGLRSIVE